MSRKEINQAYQQMTYDIYVGNVPKNLTENELKQLFIKFGEIKQVLCRWKEDYAGIGYAIVKFVFKADAEKLLRETDEVSWNGHPLPVKAARRSDHSQYNGSAGIESKSSCFPELNSKPLFMSPPFLKGGPGYFCPSSDPFASNHIKRQTDDFPLMRDLESMPNYSEYHNVHSVPLKVEVLCTNVEDAITFYGCPVHRFDELSNIIHALSTLNLTQNRVDKKPLPKKVYAALFSEDRSWYRCTVTRTSIPNKPGMCTVRFIDYGNHEDTAYRNVVELPEQLQKVPAFASKFIFSNLMCESKSNKQTYLHQLTNKRMSLCAVFSPFVSEYQVLKCSCNGKDVISETVKKGFASFKKVQTIAAPKPLVSKSTAESVENRKNKTVVCNGTNGHAQEVLENGITSESFNAVKKSRKSSSKNKESSSKSEDVNCNEISSDLDFHPKIIIKRGSDLSEIMSSKDSLPVEAKRENEPKQPASTITVDAVISNLKLINNIRALVSQSTDDSIIQRAVKILQSEVKALELPEKFTTCVNEASKNYIHCLNEIKKCQDRAILPNLKLERDSKQKVLCDKLKEFLDNFNTSIFERKKKILQTITDLASNSNDWMNVELKAVPPNIEELVSEYNKVKEERWNLVLNAREKTNQKHKSFMEVFTSLEKEFHLNTLDGDSNMCESFLSINKEGKRTCYAVKFDEALMELGKAVDEEIHTLTLNKGKNTVSIIQCLLAELDVHKEKIESLCELYESKLNMLNDLCRIINSNAYLTQLAAIQEEVCGTLLRFTHCRDSHEKFSKTNLQPNFCELLSHEDVNLQDDSVNSQLELSSVVRELHIALLKEDSVIETLAKAADAFLPELCIEHPELKLSEYFQSKYLLKYNWKPEYFLNLEKTPKGKSSFISKLLDDPIIIKEYRHETKEDMTKFLQIVFVWNDCKCEFLLKIKALFFKKENTICVICPLVSGSLLENPPLSIPVEGEKACNLLRQLLVCLKELHSQKLIYGAVHPSTILIENGKVVLDFCFNPKVLEGNTVLKGINFHPPENEMSEKSGDMYGFGCLVLWLLFPNLSFTSTDEGVPNIAAFRSIIEEALTTKDYALLFPLVCPKPKSRPSASLLLSKGFLSNYESYCRARNKAMSCS